MATGLDVISDALKLLGIRAAESPITNVERDDGLTSLNDMLTEWDSNGIKIGFEALEDTDEELFVDDSTLGAIKANLAVYIAPEYNRTITDALAKRARDGKNVIRATLPLRSLEMPDSLPIGSGNEGGQYTSDGDIPGGVTGDRFYPANIKKCS